MSPATAADWRPRAPSEANRALAWLLGLTVALSAGCGTADTPGAPTVTVAARAEFSSLPGSVRFAVIGDSGRGSREQYALAEQLASQRERFAYDFVLMLGDNVYDSGTPQDYRDRFERPYRALLDAGVAFYAVRGNHDVGEPWLYPGFNTGGHRYFTFRKTGGPVGRLTGGVVQFFAIDSVSLDDDQLAWVERELAASRANWKICFLHHPLYTSARYWWSALAVRRKLEPLFVKHGVDVVFSGHEHVYERLQPQQGIVYFVSGAAGSVRRGDLRRSRRMAAGFDTDLHFMLVEVAGDTLRFEAIARDGHAVDAGTIRQSRERRLPSPLAR